MHLPSQRAALDSCLFTERGFKCCDCCAEIAAEKASAEKDLAITQGALELFQNRLGLEFVQSNGKGLLLVLIIQFSSAYEA